MIAIDQVCEELSAIGYEVHKALPSGAPIELAIIDYHVEVGRFKGNCFTLGIGPEGAGYPEYPPHFICIADLSDAQMPIHSTFNYNDSVWSVFSTPPKDFWDSLSLSEKNMKTYCLRHLPRFWSQV